MKKIKSRFLRQIVKSYSIMLIVITFIFSIILCWLIGIKIHNSTIEYQNEITQKTSNQVDDFLNGMNDVASRIASDTNIVVLFSNLNNDHNMSNYFKDDIVKDIDIGSELKTINGETNPVWRISVYDKYGDYISSGAITENNDEIEKKLNKLNVNDIMMNLKYSNKIIISPEKDRWSDYFKSKYISILRPVMNKYGNDVYAVVEVQEDISKLESVVDSGINNMEICIYDNNNNLIINQGKIPININNLKTSYKSYNSGWKVEIITNYQNNYIYEIIGIFAMSYILVIVSILGISYLIANRITRPLQDLSSKVKKVSSINLSVKTEDDDIDEIKDLGDAFSEVLIKMGDAVKEEKKAYFLALQSQMNPHFIFNVLSVISGSAMEIGSDKIIGMCQQLSDILRYVASYESSIVTFKDEIEHTINYLKLMEARYEDCFKYEINVNKKINDILIPKLILQPLVENCFKDAFHDIEPPWEINIDIGIRDECWYIKVSDNGIGFSEGQIESIDEKIKRFSTSLEYNYKELKIGGLGLVSTIIRLKLAFYKDIKYCIERIENRITIITISGRIMEGEIR